MKGFKKVFYIFIATLMLFTLSVTAFAGNETNDGNIKIQVATDKGSYGATGVAEITATITNVSGEDINNVTAQAVFDDLAPAGKRKSETSKSVDVLKSGESFSFTYKATLNKDEHKLNIFQKIILWFVRLFNGGYNANNNNIDVVSECVTEIEFGKFTAENVVQVGCDLEGFTEQELDYMDSVDKTLKDLKSTNDFKSLDENERKEKIESQLEELEKQGKINSIIYDTKTKSFVFMYSSGISGGVSLESYNDGPVNELDFASKNTSQSNYIVNNTLLTQFNDNQFTNSKKNIFISYGWDDINDRDSYYSGYAERIEYYKSSCDLSVILSVDTTVEDYKTAFIGKDLVCIMEHGKTVAVHDFFGYENEDFWLNTTYINTFITREIPTKQTDAAYYEDLHEHRIYKRDNVYCITPEFFSHYYSGDKLDDTIVFMGSCSAFGSGSVVDYNFSHKFCEYCGADVLIGFHNDTIIGYSSSVMDILITNLVNGMTVSESINYGQKQLGYNDCEWIRKNYTEEEMKMKILESGKTLLEDTEYRETNNIEGTPIVAGKGTIKWDLSTGTLTGTVYNETMTAVIPDVKIEVIDNNSDSFDPIATATTDLNGKYTLKLPYGDYSISFTHSDYEYYGMSLTVNNESYIRDIALLDLGSEKDGVGTVSFEVKDKETNEVMKDFWAWIRLSYSSEISFKKAISNGIVTVGLPIGEYVCILSKEGYKSKTFNFTIQKDVDTVITNPVYMVKEDVEDTKTIIDSGECGADGSNVTWTLYEDGELVISGSGKMKDYSSSNSPWYSYNESITKVTIKNGITHIGNGAFYWCTALENIFISNSIKTIGDSAFYNCHSIISITVDKNNQNYSSENGVLFNKEKTTLIKYPAANSRESYTIPGSIKNIGELAFKACDRLKSLTIGDRVVNIENYAFYGCENLINIIIPDSVITIGDFAFDLCNSLKNVTIGNGVTSISDSAFYSCGSLTSITVAEDNQNYSSEDGVLFNKEKTTLIRHPTANGRKSYIIPDSVTTIRDSAFAYNSLSSITIPNSVTSIGNAAFYCCSSLTNIIISDSVTTIGELAFAYCNSLKNVTIGRNVTTIGFYAFAHCYNFTSIKIGKSVTSIGQDAFYCCDKLTDVYYKGSETQWQKIDIDGGNTNLTNATIHYNS